MEEIKGNFDSSAQRAGCSCKCSQFDDKDNTYNGASNGTGPGCRCSCLFSDDRNNAFDSAHNNK